MSCAMWITGLPGSGKPVLTQAVRCGRSCMRRISRARPPRAFDTAGELAQYHRARLLVLHILPLPSPFANGNRHRARGSSRRGLTPRPSAVSTRLVARARRARGYDRDPRPLRSRRLVHGSMARVLHIAECPVLMMRTAGREADHYFSSAEGFS